MIDLNECSSFFIPITAAALALISAIFILFRFPKSPQKAKKYHPIGSSHLSQVLNFYRLHDFMTDLSRKHKTYRLSTLFRSEIFTTDPAVVEYMLKTNFPNYGKGLYQYNILTDLLGDGIFAVDGDKWKHQRKLSSYEFSTKILRDFSSVVFKTTAVKLARIVSEASASNRPLDMQYPDIQEKIAKEIIEATQVSSNSSIEELAARDPKRNSDRRWLSEKGHFQPRALSSSQPSRGSENRLGKDFAYRQMNFLYDPLGSYKFKLNDESKPSHIELL
ncbi:cytochrome P450 704C1-like [Pistacia vera]|uniref:cytochrome P450 704C1-like n=1 Tax=Pistacia vera TaxID=55513 RepID=UPI0012638FFF|nr:cytochrome P450 704C1-like [Pistacia vera]